MTTEEARHEFDPGHTGMSTQCNALVEREGYADTCDLTRAEHAAEPLPGHVSPDCDDDGCYCPDDVFWGRLLGDDDPCAPGKDWAAAAFGDLDDDEEDRA